MKALLDAQLSPDIARVLRGRGLDVDAVAARPDIPDATSDVGLMEIAATEDRAVVTNNIKDFRPIAGRRLQRGQGHAGLILVPSSRHRTRATSWRSPTRSRRSCARTRMGWRAASAGCDARRPR